MAQCLIDFPIKIPSTSRALLLPQEINRAHPLISKIPLLSVPLSGQKSKQQIFQRNWTKLFAIHRKQKPCSKTKKFPRNGMNTAFNGKKNSYIADVNTVLEFLHGRYKGGRRYSGICAARITLSSVVAIWGYVKLTNHSLVSR